MEDNLKYTAQEIADNGWIIPPSGSDNPTTKYLYIIRLIKRKELRARKKGGEYQIAGSEIRRFLEGNKTNTC